MSENVSFSQLSWSDPLQLARLASVSLAVLNVYITLRRQGLVNLITFMDVQVLLSCLLPVF